jgi:hypothetical protein
VKIEKEPSAKKQPRSKTKKKRQEQLNINNNNGIMSDYSLTSFTNENGFILPQIGYSSRAETDDTSEYSKYNRGQKHQVFYRQPSGRYDRMAINSDLKKHSYFVNHSSAFN